MDNEKIILDLYKRVVELEMKLDKAFEEIERLKLNGNQAIIASTKKESIGVKDTTKYLFNGKAYGKSRLVLAVVQAFVEQYPDISATELLKTFDTSLQGPFGVFNCADVLEEKYKNNSVEFGRRYFIKDNESIQLKDGTKIYVCNQWGQKNINKFIANAKEHGFIIKEI